MASYNYTIDSGWTNTYSAEWRNGPTSFSWLAKVAFEVPDTSVGVLIVTDRAFAGELPAIYDEFGTTVGDVNAF